MFSRKLYRSLNATVGCSTRWLEHSNYGEILSLRIKILEHCYRIEFGGSPKRRFALQAVANFDCNYIVSRQWLNDKKTCRFPQWDACNLHCVHQAHYITGQLNLPTNFFLRFVDYSYQSSVINSMLRMRLSYVNEHLRVESRRAQRMRTGLEAKEGRPERKRACMVVMQNNRRLVRIDWFNDELICHTHTLDRRVRGASIDFCDYLLSRGHKKNIANKIFSRWICVHIFAISVFSARSLRYVDFWGWRVLVSIHLTHGKQCSRGVSDKIVWIEHYLWVVRMILIDRCGNWTISNKFNGIQNSHISRKLLFLSPNTHRTVAIKLAANTFASKWKPMTMTYATDTFQINSYWSERAYLQP